MNTILMVCLQISLVFFGVACHRPLPELAGIPSYPDRPEGVATDVDGVLSGYSDRVGPVPPVTQKVLDARAVRRLALENSPEVLQAKAGLDRALAHLRTSAAWPNPELDGLYLMDADGNFSSETTFRFALPLGGRVGASAELASRELDLARLELLAARRRALARTDRILARLAHARSRLQLIKSLADRSYKYAELARTRRTASMADPLDVALVLADARADRRTVQRAEARLHALEQQIGLLAGLPPGGVEFEPGVHNRARLIETPQALNADLAKHNLEILRSRLHVLVADLKASRAAAERVPDLHLGPAVTTEGESLAVGISLGMPIPLLQTGQGPYEEALAERRMAQEAYQQSLRAAVSRVATTLASLKSCQQELDEVLGEAGAALEEAVKLAEVRYSAGKLDVLRLLSVHRAYAELKLQQLSLLRKNHEILIDLREALGRPVRIEEVIP